eukprot:CAMPEP_0197023142 /NCGR_PEP_ID=MMETSP1384-20130603/3929_1 /TAXON_ID=29189 /ORGANISM="Ammonia sp." /LENGTH=516 /DNA_ID=CAMNT_0042451327 /DNA_START=60 /DNA_END=1610 /DNA_ORIENTATION=+
MEASSPSRSSFKMSLINAKHPFRGRRRYFLFNHDQYDLQMHPESNSKPLHNDSCRFLSMAVLTSTMMFAEIVTGIATGSLTLLSDALHMLSDLIALIIGFSANRMANGEATQNSFDHTMVYMRYEIVGALINGTILMTSCLIMAIEAIQRILFHHEGIENVDFVLIVGGLGLFINIIGLCIFGHHGHDHSHHDHDHTQLSSTHSDDMLDENVPSLHLPSPQKNAMKRQLHQHHEHNHSCSHHHQHEHELVDEEKQADNDSQVISTHGHEENLNVHGVFLHILGDLLGSVAVMISAVIIKFTDGWWTLYIDPVCTLLIVSLISRSAWPLVKRSANILLDKSPFTADIIHAIERELTDIPGVLNMHELHCWQVKTGYFMATVHLIIDPNWKDNDHTDEYCQNECDLLHDKMTIIDRAKAILHRYGIHSSIVQSEFPKIGDQEWQKANDPCFDFVCDTSDCIKKSVALSNSMANLKKRMNMEKRESPVGSNSGPKPLARESEKDELRQDCVVDVEADTK